MILTYKNKREKNKCSNVHYALIQNKVLEVPKSQFQPKKMELFLDETEGSNQGKEFRLQGPPIDYIVLRFSAAREQKEPPEMHRRANYRMHHYTGGEQAQIPNEIPPRKYAAVTAVSSYVRGEGRVNRSIP